jgi:hypothetical protein
MSRPSTSFLLAAKTWMPGTSSAKTRFALLPGHDELQHNAQNPDATSRPRGAMRPRCAFISRPFEGVGNAGCPLHPRPRVHLVVVKRTRVTTSTPESPGIPARNGFNGLLRALPGDRALLPPSSADLVLSAPGRADLTSANLTPASGRQDHTTSPSAATSFVSSPFDRSPVFRPALHHVARLTLPRPPQPTPRS